MSTNSKRQMQAVNNKLMSDPHANVSPGKAPPLSPSSSPLTADVVPRTPMASSPSPENLSVDSTSSGREVGSSTSNPFSHPSLGRMQTVPRHSVLTSPYIASNYSRENANTIDTLRDSAPSYKTVPIGDNVDMQDDNSNDRLPFANVSRPTSPPLGASLHEQRRPETLSEHRASSNYLKQTMNSIKSSA